MWSLGLRYDLRSFDDWIIVVGRKMHHSKVLTAWRISQTTVEELPVIIKDAILPRNIPIQRRSQRTLRNYTVLWNQHELLWLTIELIIIWIIMVILFGLSKRVSPLCRGWIASCRLIRRVTFLVLFSLRPIACVEETA